MRLAILADIHGNSDAFEAVIKQIELDQIEKFIIAGDLVGYYYNVKKVLQELEKFDYIFVKGNHEEILGEALLDNKVMDKLTSKYGSSYSALSSELKQAQIEFLTSAPSSVECYFGSNSYLVAHGSPWDLYQYIYPDSSNEIWDKFLDYPQDIFILGNTHHQMIKRYKGKTIINPGSVGQSRTNMGHAQWAEIDIENLNITFRSTKYDTTELLSMCRKLDSDNALLTKYLEVKN